MGKNTLNSLIMVCCLILVGISSAVMLKNINNTYAYTKHLAYFYSNGGEWKVKNTFSDHKAIRYNDKFYLDSDDLEIYMDGCDFGGWAVGSKDGKIFSKSYIEESDDLTEFYAVWTNCVKKYTVKFNLNGAGGSISSQSIKSGGTVSNPGNPSRSGYTFLYWSTSSSGSKYNFNTKVTKNFTLYAIWEKIQEPTQEPSTPVTPEPSTPVTPGPSTPVAPQQPTVTKYTITFDLNGGTGEISSQTVEKGNKASVPDGPTKENAIFLGWFTNKSCDNEYDFDKAVTSDITLYACYANNYKIVFNRQGLPYIDSYSKDIISGSNLREYNNSSSILVVDTTTYSMINKDSCSTVLKKLYNSLSSTKLEEKCNNINKIVSCSSNEKCRANKYIILEDTEKEEVLYLKNNDVINLGYEVYKYLGLYNDSECKNEFNYSSSVNSDLELYECYELTDESSEEPVIEPEPNKKKGISATLVLIIIAILSVVAFLVYLFFKGKIANKVD